MLRLESGFRLIWDLLLLEPSNWIWSPSPETAGLGRKLPSHFSCYNMVFFAAADLAQSIVGPKGSTSIAEKEMQSSVANRALPK